MLVSIVILNYNNCDCTINCVNSLKTLKNYNDCKIIIVDNASKNNCINKLTNTFPDTTLILNKENLGFSGGVNVGIKKALEYKSNYIWVLNSDTIVNSSSLAMLIDSNQKIITGSKIYFSKGKEFHKERYDSRELGHVIWYAGGLIDWKNMYASHLGVDEVDNGKYTEDINTDFITGCSMFVPSCAISDIGYFDEKYFLYFEDLDYSLRAKKAGYKLIVKNKSVIWHDNASSSGGTGSNLQRYYQTRNRLIIGFKYASIRTKIALIKQSFFQLLSSDSLTKTAIVDFLFMKFGKRNV